jgi:Leucine-rich repeat (LRR) protein
MARQKTNETAEQEIAKAISKKASRLNLSHSELTALSESLGQLTQLQSLDLSDNSLTALPESLGRCE